MDAANELGPLTATCDSSLRPDFSGRTAVITGAAQGIGAAIASHFLAAGCRVVLIDWDGNELFNRWHASDYRKLLLPANVTEISEVNSAISTALEWSTTIDIVINNAGITRDSVVWKMTGQAWQDVIDVHLTGTFNVTRAIVPIMRDCGYGRIVNVTSYTGLHGNFGQANYAAAKAGIVGFTKAVARETATFGITANAISPNAKTSMVDAVSPSSLSRLLAQIPMGRFAQPDEIAPAVLFLASHEAGYITGVVLAVDGGMSM